jgi:hypothetical protein
VLLATNRESVDRFVADNPTGGTFWVGGSVLNEAEVADLRARGYSVTVFAHRLTTVDDIEDAVATMEEHHPRDRVFVDLLLR